MKIKVQKPPGEDKWVKAVLVRNFTKSKVVTTVTVRYDDDTEEERVSLSRTKVVDHYEGNDECPGCCGTGRGTEWLPNTHYLVTYDNKENPHKEIPVAKTMACRRPDAPPRLGPYIHYCKDTKTWNLCDQNGKILYYVEDKSSNKMPPSEGWETQKEYTFETKPLGLDLEVKGNKVVVRKMNKHGIAVGSQLVSVNNLIVRWFNLSRVIKEIGAAQLPITICFECPTGDRRRRLAYSEPEKRRRLKS